MGTPSLSHSVLSPAEALHPSRHGIAELGEVDFSVAIHVDLADHGILGEPLCLKRTGGYRRDDGASTLI